MQAIQVSRARGKWMRAIEEKLQSRKLELALNQVRQMTGIGNYWSWIQAPELQNGIDIAAIVSPLRYDVLVRRDFFTFYANHREQYRLDWTSFVNLTKSTPYYTWYLESEAVRTNKHLRGKTTALESDFSERIRRAVGLYESVENEGFSPRFPITLKTAKRLLPPTTDRGGPPTGKRIRARYFLADGCHRLALLMAMGYQVLPPEFFRVKRFQEFSPFDSTSLLARRLVSDPSEYFAFLSSRYTAPAVARTRDELLAYVQAHTPELLDEVLSVIRADGFDGNRENDA